MTKRYLGSSHEENDLLSLPRGSLENQLDSLEWALKFMKDYERKHKC